MKHKLIKAKFICEYGEVFYVAQTLVCYFVKFEFVTVKNYNLKKNKNKSVINEM